MASKHHDSVRTRKNWWQLKKLKIRVLIWQYFECYLCEEDIIERMLPYALHHIDHNPRNNRHTNLMVLCKDCHKKVHGRY